MTNKTDIERRFAPTEEKQFSDPEYVSYFGDLPHGVKKWSDLLMTSPVVVLGEGRIGKTFEFVSQVEQLRSQDQFAFFVPLERLHDENLDEALEPEDVELFNAWKSSASSIGYFFLDALDELKLREGTLRKALRKLQDAVEPHFGRVNVILSCRPADWKTTVDQHSLKAFCVSIKARRGRSIAVLRLPGIGRVTVVTVRLEALNTQRLKQKPQASLLSSLVCPASKYRTLNGRISLRKMCRATQVLLVALSTTIETRWRMPRKVLRIRRGT